MWRVRCAEKRDWAWLDAEEVLRGVEKGKCCVVDEDGQVRSGGAGAGTGTGELINRALEIQLASSLGSLFPVTFEVYIGPSALLPPVQAVRYGERGGDVRWARRGGRGRQEGSRAR
eukprot:573734-Hanusia_phi.AAC.3